MHDKLLAAGETGRMAPRRRRPREEAAVSVQEQVLAGGAPINPGIAAHLLGVFRKLAHADASAPDPIELALVGLDTKLSSRESEVLKLVARGYSDKEVAANLLIAKSTVDTHVRAIFRKFSVHSRAQLRRAIGC